MVAYSFQRQFVVPIQQGLGIDNIDLGVVPKRHTIRADRKRHARPGEELQLYRGMRTRGCFLIGRARCTSISTITLVFRGEAIGVWIDGTRTAASLRARNAFARSDGFNDWAGLVEFWKENHGPLGSWDGVIIRWEPLA
jgi:hypothetical protein